MKKISEFKESTTGLQGHELLAAVDLNRPNSADRNIKPTLSQVRDFITGGMPIPPPDTEWIVMPTVTNDPQTPFKFDVDAAGEASFPSDPDPVAFGATSYTVPAASAGLEYVFLIYAKSDGTYGTVSGPQSQNPAVPPYPANALYVSHAIVSETGGEVQEPPTYLTEERLQEVLKRYLKKDLTDWETSFLNGEGYTFQQGQPGDALFAQSFIDGGGLGFTREQTLNGINYAHQSGVSLGPDGQGRYELMAVGGKSSRYYRKASVDGKLEHRFEFFDNATANGTPASVIHIDASGIYLNGEPFSGGGAVKLYPGTGQNTDGAMTQKAATDAIAAASNVAQVANLGHVSGGFSVTFDTKKIINATISSGSVTVTPNTAGLQPGIPCLFSLDLSAGFAPSFAAPFVKKSGDFVAGMKNYTECLAISSTEILYEIYQ